MRVFELKAAEAESLDGEVRSRWCLPGVHCPACDETWAEVGISYPTVSLAGLEEAARYEDLWPVPWGNFIELRARIEHLLPRGLPAPPGTDLGPLVGEVIGTVRDLTWLHPWTVLCTSSAFMRLRSGGLPSLRGAVAAVKIDGETHEQLVELEIEAHGGMAASCQVDWGTVCGVCGRREVSRPPQLVLSRDSLPGNKALFRLTDLPTAVFASEETVETLAHLRLQAWRAEEVELE